MNAVMEVIGALLFAIARWIDYASPAKWITLFAFLAAIYVRGETWLSSLFLVFAVFMLGIVSIQKDKAEKVKAPPSVTR